MTHAQWLAKRRRSIGGSDAAAIAGMNQYVTPYMLWADKTGRLPPKPDNEAMRQGRDLEQYVADRFMEATGKRVRRRGSFLRNQKYPFAHANIDRAVVGERAGLECKTTSIMNLEKFKNGEFPKNYYVQCVHYLAVTGWDRWYLAVLILNQGFYTFVVERDEKEIAALMGAEEAFWNRYVVPDCPPAADGKMPTSETLEAIFPGSNPKESPLDLVGREEIIKNYLAAKELERAYKLDAEKYCQMLKQDLQNREEGICGKYSVRWKLQLRNSFDVKRFVADHPEIDLSRYYNAHTYRIFSVKELS